MQLAGLTVLLVDDYLESLELVQTALSMEGANVVAAPDAEMGSRILDRDPVGLIVADLGMPRIDGLELMRRVRARADEKRRTPRSRSRPTAARRRCAPRSTRASMRPS